MPSLGPALTGFEEAVAEAKKHKVRAILHNAPAVDAQAAAGGRGGWGSAGRRGSLQPSEL